MARPPGDPERRLRPIKVSCTEEEAELLLSDPERARDALQASLRSPRAALARAARRRQAGVPLPRTNRPRIYVDAKSRARVEEIASETGLSLSVVVRDLLLGSPLFG